MRGFAGARNAAAHLAPLPHVVTAFVDEMPATGVVGASAEALAVGGGEDLRRRPHDPVDHGIEVVGAVRPDERVGVRREAEAPEAPRELVVERGDEVGIGAAAVGDVGEEPVQELADEERALERALGGQRAAVRMVEDGGVPLGGDQRGVTPPVEEVLGCEQSLVSGSGRFPGGRVGEVECESAADPGEFGWALRAQRDMARHGFMYYLY
jgi:hypothetical protein